MDKSERSIRMSVGATPRFQKLLGALAIAKDISRDELIERAVRIAFADDVANIEATFENDSEDEDSRAPTRTAVREIA